MTGPSALALLAIALLLSGIPAILGPAPSTDGYAAFLVSRGDTHTHTLYSDGSTDIPTLISKAESRNLTWVVATDHNGVPPQGECEGLTTAAFVCLRGAEITELNAHVTAIGIRGDMYFGAPGIGELMHESAQQGALNFLAHPFSEQAGTDYGFFGVHENYTGLEIYHGYAGWNDVALTSDMDALAVQKWDDLLSSGRRVVGVGASDTHDANATWDQGDLLNARGAVGYPRDVAYLREFSVRGVLEALEHGRVIVTDGPTLEFTVAGAVAGEEVRADVGTPLAVNFTGSVSVSSTVRLIANGGVVYSQSVGPGPFALGTIYNPGGDAYLRAEVRTFNGNFLKGETGLAFANPVYIDTPPYDSEPAPPSNLRAWIEGADVMLAWDPSPSPDASHYAIYRDAQPSGFDLTYRHARSWRTTWRDVGAALDGETHYYRVNAIDRMGHEEGGTALAVKMAFPVVPGPNLLSVPIPLLNASLPSVLQTVGYETVRRFDAASPEPWSASHSGRGGPLDSIPTGAAFWVNATAAGTYAIAGTVPPVTAIPLRAGWNLVANPAHTPRTVTASLAAVPWTRLEVFDPTAAPYRLRRATSAEILQPGVGLWVHVTADTTWVVPA